MSTPPQRFGAWLPSGGPEGDPKRGKMAGDSPPRAAKWLPFILVSVAIHLLVLLWLVWPSSAPVREEPHHYVEITLEAMPPPPPPPVPVAPPLPDTKILGLAPGIKSDKPATPPPAMARVPIPETPVSPDATMVQQAANQVGPDTAGAMWGTGQGAGGGGGNRFKVIAVPQGLTWRAAEVAALAWDGRAAFLDSEEDEQTVFQLADDPQYWRNSDTASFGPWLGGDFRFKSHPDKNRETGGGYNGPSFVSIPNDYGPVLFEGPTPNQRQAKVVQMVDDTSSEGDGFLAGGVYSNDAHLRANGFVVEYAPFSLGAGDISLAKGHWQNHTYEVFAVAPKSLGINWLAAEAQARARGGYLAIIRSAEENDFVYKLTLQKAGAWRSESAHDHATARTIVLDVGPWLGGFRLRDMEDDRWKWFHFAASPSDTGLSTDTISHFYLSHYSPGIGDEFIGGFPDQVGALHFAKLHTESIATWGLMGAHLLNPGYVVEYDDPPAVAK